VYILIKKIIKTVMTFENEMKKFENKFNRKWKLNGKRNLDPIIY
jgi:hypothetical protein